MRLWTPEPDQPELVDWYRPLLALGRVLRDEQFAFPPRIDDYVLAGRIDRPPRPAVWAYVHWSGGTVHVDADAQTYTWRRHRDGRGHFQKVDARTAMHRAGIFTAEVEVEHRVGRLPSGNVVADWREHEWRFDPWTGQALNPAVHYDAAPDEPTRLRLVKPSDR